MENGCPVTAANAKFTGITDKKLQIMVNMRNEFPILYPADVKITDSVFVVQHLASPICIISIFDYKINGFILAFFRVVRYDESSTEKYCFVRKDDNP